MSNGPEEMDTEELRKSLGQMSMSEAEEEPKGKEKEPKGKEKEPKGKEKEEEDIDIVGEEADEEPNGKERTAK
jgi:hypothetical protein